MQTARQYMVRVLNITVFSFTDSKFFSKSFEQLLCLFGSGPSGTGYPQQAPYPGAGGVPPYPTGGDQQYPGSGPVPPYPTGQGGGAPYP